MFVSVALEKRGDGPGWCLLNEVTGCNRKVYKRVARFASEDDDDKEPNAYFSQQVRFNVQTGVTVGRTRARLPGSSSPNVHVGDKAGTFVRCWTCVFPSVSLSLPSAQEGFPPGAARFLRGQEAPRRSRAGGLMEELDHWIGRPETSVFNPLRL